MLQSTTVNVGQYISRFVSVNGHTALIAFYTTGRKASLFKTYTELQTLMASAVTFHHFFTVSL